MKSALSSKPVLTKTPKTMPDTASVATSETGETVETLKLFAAIHKSNQFSIDAAHQLFAGIRRTQK
jgi:fructoselysine-6-P-deglycase FrlB-like protein